MYAIRSYYEIIAVAKGVVTFVGTQSGYGNVVEINHGNGITTRYGHNRITSYNVCYTKLLRLP